MKPWEYSILQAKCQTIQRDLSKSNLSQFQLSNCGDEMDTSYVNRNGKYETHGDYSHFMALAACKRKAAHVTTDSYKVITPKLLWKLLDIIKKGKCAYC